VIRVTLVSNALHLEAVRRLRRLEPASCSPGFSPLELLIWEPQRMTLAAADRRLWRWRWPVTRAGMAVLQLLAQLGLVAELRLAHLRAAGWGLRGLAARARRLTLLDDGLDQYRDRPRAVDPEAFPAGTPCWLFSDLPAARAGWCERFDCRELGPLYEPPALEEGPNPWGDRARPGPWRTLILDAPGLERDDPQLRQLPHPWLVLAHPVAAKRSWRQRARPGDGTAADLGPGFGPGSAERLLAGFGGTIVVGESMTLLAAARLRPATSRLLVMLPENVDANVRCLALRLAADDATIDVLGLAASP
jgi:hypothetical protein